MKKNSFGSQLSQVNTIYLDQHEFDFFSYSQLKQNFKTAKDILKRTYIEPNKPAYNLPHYLVIGPENCGKSSLLENFEVEFLEHDKLVQRTPEGLLTTAHTNWWVTKDAVFVDVPGHYLTSSSHAVEKKSAWLSLLNLLKKHKRITSILLVIDIPSITFSTATDIRLQLDILQARLQELGSVLKYPLAAQLILSKIDTIEGFTEFFDDLGREEREQSWGIILAPSQGTTKDKLDNFNSLFVDLLKRLNERVIWRLHQGHSLHNKNLIKNFTLQIESLKKPIENLILRLATLCNYHKHLQLTGIFFSSSKQNDFTADFLLNNLNQQLNLPLTQQPKMSVKNQPFFIKAIIQYVIKLHGKVAPVKNLHPHNQTVHAATWIAGLVITSILLGYFYLSYQQQKTALYSTQQTINNYHTLSAKANNIASYSQILSLLNALASASNQTEKTSKLPALFFNDTQSEILHSKLNAVYQQALQNKLLPFIKFSIEKKLLVNNTLPEDLYSALTAYLMLSDLNKLDLNYFANWLAVNFESATNKNNAIMPHLKELFKKPNFKTIVINAQILKQARQELNSLPEPVLIYAILKSQNLTNIFINDLAGKTSEQIFNLRPPLALPANFTIDNFNRNFKAERVLQAKIFAATDSVLALNFKAIKSNSLANTVQSLYVNEYIEKWQQLIDNLQIVKFKDIAQAANVLDLTTADKSTMKLLMDSLAKNLTVPITDASYLKFAPLHTLLQKDAKKYLSLQTTLDNDTKKLKGLLLEIKNASNPDQYAFEVAANRIKAHDEHDAISQLLLDAQQAPYPLKQWYTSIAANSWQIILERAKNHININWVKSIQPVYKSSIANRFPINQALSVKDISTPDFTRFFGTNGIIEAFSKTFLEPFIDTTQAQWTVKELNGQKLDINTATLLQFERAYVINKMFFNQAGKLATNFTLDLLATTPNIKSIMLIFNQQKYTFVPGITKQPVAINWNSTDKFSFQLLDYQDKSISFNQDSAWALLRFLKQANLTQTNDTKHFEFEYENNGYIAKFVLTTDQLINPFLTSVIEQFQCPEKL